MSVLRDTERMQAHRVFNVVVFRFSAIYFRLFFEHIIVMVRESKSNFIRNAACTRTNISIVINCQHVALHGCHLAKSRLPVTSSSLKK